MASGRWGRIAIAAIVACSAVTARAAAQEPIPIVVPIAQPAPVIVVARASAPLIVAPAPLVVTESPYVQPERSDWVQGEMEITRGPTLPLLIPGAIALGVTWIATGLVGMLQIDGLTCDPDFYFHDRNCPRDRDGWVAAAWIPIVGPWIALGAHGPFGAEMMIASGIVQDVATIALVLGLAIETEKMRPVRADLGGGVELAVSAAPTSGGGSVAAHLSF